MNWDMKTASDREKLLILERKLGALYQLQPDLTARKPYSFFPYMAEDCVLRSEKLPEPLTGQAVRDFLIREKRAGTGFGPLPRPDMAESTEDGEILLRIRPNFRDETPDGELVRLELNAEGKVREIIRFDEKKLPYRIIGTCVGLCPVREIREGETVRREKDSSEAVTVTSLYYDEMTLIFDVLPQCPFFTDMEERYMEISDWAAILKTWKAINEAPDCEALRDMIFRTEEEYVRKNPSYGEELEELIRAVLRKREPYGRRMQAWMEDWLNGLGDRYDCILKC